MPARSVPTGAPLGNPNFGSTVDRAAPDFPAVLALSWAHFPPTASCEVVVDFTPGQLILPLGPWGFTTIDSLGHASIPLPLPNDPLLRGLAAHAQRGILDSSGTTGVALTQGARIVIH